jgi:hypothetical protein
VIICGVLSLLLCVFVSSSLRSIPSDSENIEAANTLAEGNLLLHIEVDKKANSRERPLSSDDEK